MARTRLKKRGPPINSLTDQRRQWVQIYADTLNATEATVQVYNPKNRANASKMGAKILKDPKVQAAVGYLLEQKRRVRKVEADEVLTHLADCATRDFRLLIDPRTGLLRLNTALIAKKTGLVLGGGHLVSELPEAITNAIDGCRQKGTVYFNEDGSLDRLEFETELKLVSKAGAIDMAAKHLGLYAPEKREESVRLDWDSLPPKPPPPDRLEEELKALPKPEEEA